MDGHRRPPVVSASSRNVGMRLAYASDFSRDLYHIILWDSRNGRKRQMSEKRKQLSALYAEVEVDGGGDGGTKKKKKPSL